MSSYGEGMSFPFHWHCAETEKREQHPEARYSLGLPSQMSAYGPGWYAGTTKRSRAGLPEPRSMVSAPALQNEHERDFPSPD